MRPRTRRTVIALAAGAVLLAACSQTTLPVATVDGSPIGEDQVLALRHSYQDTSSVSGENFRQDLTRLIFLAAEEHAAAEQFGLTDLDDPAAIDLKLGTPSGDELQLFQSIRSQADFTDETIRLAAQQLVVRERVAEKILQDDQGYLRDLFDNQRSLVSQVCVRHILTATEPEIEDVLARLEAGEDFAAIADDVSLDTQSPGGVLPCPIPAGSFPETFGEAASTAEIGQVTGPIQTEFGWHVLIVDQRAAPETFEELRSDPLAFVHPTAVNDAWTRWLDEVVAEAEIDVRSDVGTWVASADGIAPPPEG